MRAKFVPIVAGVRTSDELRRVINLMLGELNSSHSGAAGGTPYQGQASNSGRLGVTFDRGEYESGGRLKVTSVLPLGPAAISKQITVGDYITSVNGIAVNAAFNLDEQMMHAVGKRTEVRVSKTPDGAGARTVVVAPMAAGAERTLLYRDWVEANRAYVDKISGGKLGYVHIRDMSEAALKIQAIYESVS